MQYDSFFMIDISLRALWYQRGVGMVYYYSITLDGLSKSSISNKEHITAFSEARTTNSGSESSLCRRQHVKSSPCAVRAPAVGPLDRQLGFLRITSERPQTIPLHVNNTSTGLLRYP